MSLYTISEETLTSIADALRKQYQINEKFTPGEIAAKINNTNLGLPIHVNLRVTEHINQETDEWERPSTWPDIEALADDITGDADCLYLTYDLSCHDDYQWIGLRAGLSSTNKKWHLDHLKYVNNEWTSIEHFEIASGTAFRQELEGDTIQLWRVTCPETHITNFGFVSNTSTAADNYYNGCQPCVERAGQLLWCNYMSGGNHSQDPNILGGSTHWLEHDCMVMGTNANVTSLNNIWSYSYNLYSLDVSKWSTSNWQVTTLQNLFGYCMSLKKLDLHNWDTSNWAVTTIAYLFNTCINLQELDISTWDTHNWAVTTMSQTWTRCSNLLQLDLNHWDTSNWTITNMSDTWNRCNNLQSLKIDEWDTSNWAVTTLANTWMWCTSLRELHLNDWVTSSWAVTTLAYTWGYCYNLKVLEISDWSTSNWTVTSMNYTWYMCKSLEELHLNNWITSSWAVTTLTNAWSYNHSLKILEVDQWNTTNWAVTSINGAWNMNISLKALNINSWNTSNWAVTSLASTWNCCSSLNTLDIHSWDTSKWKVTNTDSIFGQFLNCETLLTPESIGILSTQTSSISYTPNTPYKLKNYSGYAIYVNHSYSEAYNLTTASAKNIINRLPTVSTARTITLNAIVKLKLSQEDIASATQKGWTIA